MFEVKSFNIQHLQNGRHIRYQTPQGLSVLETVNQQHHHLLPKKLLQNLSADLQLSFGQTSLSQLET